MGACVRSAVIVLRSADSCPGSLVSARLLRPSPMSTHLRSYLRRSPVLFELDCVRRPPCRHGDMSTADMLP